MSFESTINTPPLFRGECTAWSLLEDLLSASRPSIGVYPDSATKAEERYQQGNQESADGKEGRLYESNRTRVLLLRVHNRFDV